MYYKFKQTVQLNQQCNINKRAVLYSYMHEPAFKQQAH